eukprot:TRINITY_DN19506_c0_g1_i1.p1 TRINITY_DN19506_c0_g1~~TRINITY_DN19506_c0_g1_i1.p1  ORF type:complete len:496 (-),score=123.33 TRINITY_DN19506_c0_g1_i1:25-1485(-)
MGLPPKSAQAETQDGEEEATSAAAKAPLSAIVKKEPVEPEVPQVQKPRPKWRAKVLKAKPGKTQRNTVKIKKEKGKAKPGKTQRNAVKIKKEPEDSKQSAGAKPAKAKPSKAKRGQAKGKASKGKAAERKKPMKSVKVKKEIKAVKVKSAPSSESTLVKVKKEPGVKSNKGFSLPPTEHFRHQVGFINQVVASAWEVCFGMLGTGLVGVRMKREPVAEDAAGDEAGPAAEGGSEGGSSSGAAGTSPSSSNKRLLQQGDVVILFRNAPACAAQSRNGKTSAAYEGGGLDVEKRTMSWSSQRRDKNSKLIKAIQSHVDSGGRLLVAVRPPVSTGDVDYRMLGQVCRLDNLQEAKFLVDEGDMVVQERGSSMMHKAITFHCLSASLKSGIGLTAVTYSSKLSNPRWCLSCCYRPPSAVLHFECLEPAGVMAYQLPRGAKLELQSQEEAEETAPSPRPTKRFRVKKPLEEEEDEAAETPGLVSVKREPET